MRKLLLFLALIMSIFLTVQAGLVIRGIPIIPPDDDLKNYTLSFTKEHEPIVAASMHTASAPGTGKNNIVIIQANSSMAYRFPITLVYDPNLPNDVEVRDLHYDWVRDTYVLCGARQLGLVTRAFVAVIKGDFSQMDFFEYSEADMFYSIWVENPVSTIPLDYFVCGKSGNYGVIASINRSTLQFTNLYTTADDQEWEYHKIIAKYGTPHFPRFVASGRNPECTKIGFTTLDPSFATINSYMWAQNTELKSFCVVGDDVLENNTIILASSYQNIVTLNPVTYPILSTSVRALRFSFPTIAYRYYVQDIGTIQLTDDTFRISVAGFKRNPLVLPGQSEAWHGYVVGLSPASIMQNNDYKSSNGPVSGDYEHYKIRYSEDGSFIPKEYTGGYFQNVNEMCALFGTPLTSSECDTHYGSEANYEPIPCYPFILREDSKTHSSYDSYQSNQDEMNFEEVCPIFKGTAPAPELIMAAEQESEIITFYDRITVKDTPANINYQIFSIQGQLIQTGTTTSDISTAQLSRGIYILRLENGKAFKFVK